MINVAPMRVNQSAQNRISHSHEQGKALISPFTIALGIGFEPSNYRMDSTFQKYDFFKSYTS